MVLLQQKHGRKQFGIIVVCIIIAIILIVYPFEATGRTPPRIAKHHSKPFKPVVSQRIERDEIRIREAQRDLAEAQYALQRASQQRANAYIPRAIDYAESREINILFGEINYEQKLSDLRAADNDLYLLKRIKESDERDLRIRQQRQQYRSPRL